jgi:mannose/cellobiose epimerase-like protein (N-acyl-D-glucosamine 2-epimerase family)
MQPGHSTAACVLIMPMNAVQGVEKAMEVLRLLLSATAHKQCQQALLLFQGYSG